MTARLLSVLSVLSVLALLLLATPVLAHEGDVAGAGFVTGFLHPILGWDHVAAMAAVGLWGAFLGQPAIWVLPVAFPLVMALGAASALFGLTLPAVEIGIAGSAVVIGAPAAAGLRQSTRHVSGPRTCSSR